MNGAHLAPFMRRDGLKLTIPASSAGGAARGGSQKVRLFRKDWVVSWPNESRSWP